MLASYINIFSTNRTHREINKCLCSLDIILAIAAVIHKYVIHFRVSAWRHKLEKFAITVTSHTISALFFLFLHVVVFFFFFVCLIPQSIFRFFLSRWLSALLMLPFIFFFLKASSSDVFSFVATVGTFENCWMNNKWEMNELIKMPRICLINSMYEAESGWQYRQIDLFRYFEM